MEHITLVLLLLFLALTFLQSGIDKITDWQGNISWLNQHFEKTFLKNNVKPALFSVLVLEIVAGVISIIGVLEIFIYESTAHAKLAGVVSCITLLCLLFGQRVAKDYDGARTIVIYFIPAILTVYWA